MKNIDVLNSIAEQFTSRSYRMSLLTAAVIMRKAGVTEVTISRADLEALIEVEATTLVDADGIHIKIPQ